MTEFAARIGRVRLKGGADLHILPTTPPEAPEGLHAKVVEHAGYMAGHSQPGCELDGYVLIGMFSNGHTSVGYRLPPRMAPTLATAWICEVVRRELMVENTARNVFDDMFQWVEGGSAS